MLVKINSDMKHAALLPNTRLGACALVAVLLATVWLRFGGITEVGIRFDDEAAYSADARLWHRCAKLMIDGQAISAVLDGNKQAFQGRVEALGIVFEDRYSTPSQGYTFLGSAMMFIVGDDPAALLVVNAICGCLTVVVLYCLGVVLFCRTTALCAAALLAISPYHLVYCRSAFPNASSTLFVTVCLLCWAMGRSGRWPWRRAYLLSGIAIGYGVTCHMSVGYLGGVLVLTDMLVRRSDGSGGRSFRECIRHWSYFALGAVIPIIAIESIFQAAHLGARLSNSYLPLDTFLQDWVVFQNILSVGFSRTLAAHGIRWEILPIYAEYFVHWHGLFAGLLLLFGIGIVIQKPGPGKASAIALIVVMLLLLVHHHRVARALASVIPLACLCMAVGILSLARVWYISGGDGRFRKLATATTVVLTCAVVLPSGIRSLELYGTSSDLEAACAFVRQQGGGSIAVPHDTGQRSKYLLYLEGSDIQLTRTVWYPVETPEEYVARLRRGGVRWLITDHQHWHFLSVGHARGDTAFLWRQILHEHLAKNWVPAAEFAHVGDYCWEFLAEGPGGVGHLPDMLREEGGALRVYDLQVQTLDTPEVHRSVNARMVEPSVLPMAPDP